MITEQYKKYLHELHSRNKFSEKNLWYDDIKSFISNEPLPDSVLDFGCSHGALIQKIKNDFSEIKVVDGYDPGVLKFEKKPSRTYEMLVSTDVIEHIEPDFLDETLVYIDSLFEKTAWIIIACYPAKKSLPDGRNAHLTIETPKWWLNKVQKLMSRSQISHYEIVVQNPDNDIKKKNSNEILVPKGQQIELRLVLRKNNGTT